jgi:hypothetical protein
MPIASTWTHGNVLQIESPVFRDTQNAETGWLRLTPFGWGAQVVNEGHATVSWMHLPIPTVREPLNWGEQFTLRQVVLLFECSDAIIDSVHIYDSHQKLQEFNNLALQGTFLTIGPQNTFQLAPPKSVWTGIGLSFLFKPSASTDVGTAGLGTLTVAGAGAYFETTSSLFAKFSATAAYRAGGH